MILPFILGWCSFMVSVMLVLPLPCCVAIPGWFVCWEQARMVVLDDDSKPNFWEHLVLKNGRQTQTVLPPTGGSVGKCKICKAIIRYYTYKRRGLKHSFPWFSCSSWFINVHQFRVVFRTLPCSVPGGLGEGDDKAYLGLSASMASAGNQGASMASAGNQGASTHESEPSFPRLSWLMEMVLDGARHHQCSYAKACVSSKHLLKLKFAHTLKLSIRVGLRQILRWARSKPWWRQRRLAVTRSIVATNDCELPVEATSCVLW